LGVFRRLALAEIAAHQTRKPGTAKSSALTDGMMAEAVNGQSVTFTLEGGAMIDGAISQ